MKKYNRAFDFVIASLMEGRKGNITKAADFFNKALEAKDVIAAIKILEANNKDAHKKAVSAAKRRLAAEDLDEEIKEDVDEDVDEDIDDDVDEEVDEDVDEDEDLDDEDEEEEEDDDVTASKKRAASFAKVLASMRKKQPMKTKAKARK